MRTKKAIFFLLVFLSYVPVLAQVDTAWVRRYNGPGSGEDRATAMVVDGAGNVYVTGNSWGAGSRDDYATVKYASSGQFLGATRFQGPYEDYATALAIDGSGNLYVTGYSSNFGLCPGAYYDYITIKYAPNGDIFWTECYNGTGNYYDQAKILVLDPSRNVYVSGSSWGGVSGYDYVSVKYAPNGDTLWVKRYNGPGNADDWVSDLAVDTAGNVYVTGKSLGNGSLYDYATLKYSRTGNLEWESRYNGTNNGDDIAYAAGVDKEGNLYITGISDGSGTFGDYTTIKYTTNGDTLWVRRYNGTANDYDQPSALIVDDSGNVYVTGESVGSGTSSDYLTIKYSPSGDTLWVRRYNGTGNGPDGATVLALDDNNNVYVTGFAWSSDFSYDYATVKYSPDGNLIWAIYYNGPGNGYDRATDLTVKGHRTVYVTGYSGYVTTYDYATIKYYENKRPELDLVGPKRVTEDSNLTFRIHAVDSDGDSVTLTAFNIPLNALFIDSGNSSGSFSFNPESTQVGVFVVTFIASDSILSDTESVQITVDNLCLAKPGDANNDSTILLSDIVTIINFLFKSQPAPNPSCRADANADGSVLLTDIVYLINFIFKSGPAPEKSRECCL